MKPLVGVVVMLMAGCSDYVTKEDMDVADIVCKDNGGVHKISARAEVNTADGGEVHCKDGAIFYRNFKMVYKDLEAFRGGMPITGKYLNSPP